MANGSSTGSIMDKKNLKTLAFPVPKLRIFSKIGYE